MGPPDVPPPPSPAMSLSEMREESDAAAQFAIVWAERYGFALALFRRAEGRVLVRFGPGPGRRLVTGSAFDPYWDGGQALKPGLPPVAQELVSTQVIAGVLALDVEKSRGPARTALAMLRLF